MPLLAKLFLAPVVLAMIISCDVELQNKIIKKLIVYVITEYLSLYR